MISFKDLLEICQAEAIADKFEPNEISVYESLCRSYSKKFHTPLEKVFKLDPEYVIRQVYAEQLDEIDIDENLETLINTIKSIEDPDFIASEEEDLQDFIADAEKEEKERLAQGRSVTGKKKKKEPVKELPKEGGVNLSYLNDDENER